MTSQKRGTIIGLVDKALLLSDAENHTENLIIINTPLENDYPLDFIFNTVNKKIHSLMKEKMKETRIRSNNEIELDRISWFTVPFIPSITEKFKQFNSKDSKVGF